jgi:hypothetical protein
LYERTGVVEYVYGNMFVDNLNGLILDLNIPDLTKLKQNFDKIKIKEHVSYEYNV